MSTTPARERGAQPESQEKEASHMLQEARMVLPGVQALFGFQLVAVYNQPFSSLLTPGEQRLHVAGLLLIAVTIGLLMTPAAYHRQAEPHQISRAFLRVSSVLLTLGMFTLMVAMDLDCYLITRAILKSRLVSGLLTSGVAVILLGLWFLLPRLPRARAKRGTE
jgi:uncharacterized membrane protein YidH (DUF202 family)